MANLSSKLAYNSTKTKSAFMETNANTCMMGLSIIQRLLETKIQDKINSLNNYRIHNNIKSSLIFKD